jgi:hypothetical protein
MDDIIQCGNDLVFLGWFLIHHGKNIGGDLGDNRLAGLTQITSSLAQVLAGTQLGNKKLGQEVQAEGLKSLSLGVGKFSAQSR